MAIAAVLLSPAQATPVINEMMFHPAGNPAENPLEEWIELFNPGPEEADISGWSFTRGISIEFPPGTTIPSEGFLVVAADESVFRAQYPNVAVAIVGGWEGRLSNANESLRWRDKSGQTVETIDYATQGEWASRVNAVVHGFEGWAWQNLADGGGHSLERISPFVDANTGQLWTASTERGGSPGQLNGSYQNDVAPRILDVRQTPVIPNSDQSIRISATIVDELETPPTVQLFYRVADAQDWESHTIPQPDDGNTFSTSLGPFNDGTIVEYYFQATDTADLSRTWPKPARFFSEGEGIFQVSKWGPVTNALFQVDDSYSSEPWAPDRPPRYRIIMTPQQRTRLQQAQDQSNRGFPVDAQFHATFVSEDGTGVKVRHQCAVRDRGYSSRSGTPVNYHLAIPNDHRWNGRKSMQLNSRYPFSQALGATMFQLAGLPTTEAVSVEVRVNGVDTAHPSQVGHGRYVRAEPMNGDWISRLYPHDDEGNLYRIDDHIQFGSGQFTYEGGNVDVYRRTYLKKTNEALDDYSDIAALTKALNEAPAESYREEIEKVANVRQWLEYLAVNTLIENLEGGLGTGRADDFGIYRGVSDPRFVLLPHDFDTVMGIGERGFTGAQSDIFVYRRIRGWQRLFAEETIVREYYQVYLEMLDAWFHPGRVNPVIDQVLANWVPDNLIEQAKRFVVERRENILSQIPQTYETNVTTEIGVSLQDAPITRNGSVMVDGKFHVAETGSILVNGEQAELNYLGNDPGTWTFESAPNFLLPGVNQVAVDYYSEPDGRGEIVHSETVPVFYQKPETEVSGVLDAPNGEPILWSLESSPYHVTANLTVPEGAQLRIEPGVQVFVDAEVSLTVLGTLQILGQEHARVRFSHHPQAALRDDPVLPGVQMSPPKWGGIQLVDSLSPENIIHYADFISAQPRNNQGSIGVIRSECVIDHCTFAGTHRRMVYGRNCSLTLQHCIFPDMFSEDEDPVQLGLDNVAEQVKVESPEVPDDPRFFDGFPVGGHFRVYHNHFYGNKGHNDVFDADSGRWGQSPVLDCRYNHFHGPVGDEHIDLGGDAYVASNVFESVSKDIFTSDRGYANAISTGDRGQGTTVVVARNVFRNVDHAINLKRQTGTIFEHNTCLDFHGDYHYQSGAITQDVLCSAVNLFVPEDIGPTPGDGAYIGFNIFNNSALFTPAFPRLISWADRDQPTQPAKTSRVQIDHNLIDPQLTDDSIGERHPGGIFDERWGSGNLTGEPGDHRTIHDLPFGAGIPEWAYVAGGPASGTPQTTATFTIGGPGIFAYRWRLDDGAWSDPVEIAPGIFPRDAPTVRTAELTLEALTPGAHRLEVMGQDFAGNWQPESLVTVRQWVVDAQWQDVVINELRAVGQDAVELHNRGPRLDLEGWRLSEEPQGEDDDYQFPQKSIIETDDFLVVHDVQLNRDGDTLYLLDPEGTVVDEIAFGRQAPGYTLGRIDDGWQLTRESLGARNIAQELGDARDLRISEVLAAGDQRYRDDWIELHQAGALPIALDGVRLTDNPSGNPEAHVFPAHTYLEPNGYWKLIADGSKAKGHLNFSIAAEGESLSLFEAEGGLINVVLITPQTHDRSIAWDESGLASFPLFPTDGFAADSSEILRLTELSQNLHITEIHYDPIDGSAYEFIELTNTGALPLDLAGVRFNRGIRFTFGEFLLQAGAQVVLVSDRAAFSQRYPSLTSSEIAGEYEGKLDNSGESLTLTLPQPSGAAIQDFRYTPLAMNGHSIEPAGPSSTEWQDSGSLHGSPAGAGAVVIDPPEEETFATWAAARQQESPLADSDKDGLPALLEYALDLDPTRTDSYSLEISGSAGEREVHFLLAGERPDVIYALESSADLRDWQEIAARPPGEPWPAHVRLDDFPNGTRKISVPLPNAPTLHVRLAVHLVQ